MHSTTYVIYTLFCCFVKASDKCGVESECLSFQQHVAAAKSLWETRAPNNTLAGAANARVDIVVTSESQQILDDQQAYAASLSNHDSSSFLAQDEKFFRPRFITNHRDVAQGTGYFEDGILMGTRASSNNSSNNNNNSNVTTAVTADEVMLSAMSSLQAQLQTRFVLGNCCSNFHLLLKDLMDEGCGSALGSSFQCLQDHEDPAYRVCCSWDKSDRCQARRREQATAKGEQHSNIIR